MENLEKRLGVADTNSTNRIKEEEERIFGIEDTIEITNTTVKENTK